MPHETNAAVVEELRGRESDLYFPVSIRPLNDLMTSVHERNGRFQAVIREDTDQLLAVHKGMYRLVKNDEIFQDFEACVGGSEIDMRGVIVTDAMAYYGGRVIRDYRFPAHRVDIGEDDEVDLRLRVQNSYDGSCRFSVIMGAFRLLCSNGLVIGDTMVESKAKHTSGLNIDKVRRELQEAIDTFIQQGQIWTVWKDTPCPNAIAENVIGAIPHVSDKSKEVIMSYFTRDAANDGNTIWTLYNAMTYWSTHAGVKESSEGNKASIITERESRIRAVLNHPVFEAVA